MMKQLTYILILIFGLINCSTPKTEIDNSEKIKGDWISEYFEDGWHRSILIFTFQDSTCTYLSAFGEYSKYNLKGDTLIIKERLRKRAGNISGGKEVYKFLIDSIDSNSLSIKPITAKTKELFENYETKNFNIVKLKKVKQKNNLRFERIGFYSSKCYGTCPSMYLEIDSIGNIYFKGKGYTENDGLFAGKIPKSELELLSLKINSIQLDSLKELYSAGWTDDQECGVTIKTGKKTYVSSAYGIDKEPVELRILFHKLMEVYKIANMEKDSTITEKFQFKEFQFKVEPPIPPSINKK
jgi:hypothetical protein